MNDQLTNDLLAATNTLTAAINELNQARLSAPSIPQKSSSKLGAVLEGFDALAAAADQRPAMGVNTMPYLRANHREPWDNMVSGWHFDVHLPGGKVQRVIISHQTYRVAKQRVMKWATAREATKVLLMPRDKSREKK